MPSVVICILFTPEPPPFPHPWTKGRNHCRTEKETLLGKEIGFFVSGEVPYGFLLNIIKLNIFSSPFFSPKTNRLGHGLERRLIPWEKFDKKRWNWATNKRLIAVTTKVLIQKHKRLSTPRPGSVIWNICIFCRPGWCQILVKYWLKHKRLSTPWQGSVMSNIGIFVSIIKHYLPFRGDFTPSLVSRSRNFRHLISYSSACHQTSPHVDYEANDIKLLIVIDYYKC